jgi:hypothetical protein
VFVQAECLTWKDLSEAMLVEILEPKETSEIRRYYHEICFPNAILL